MCPVLCCPLPRSFACPLNDVVLPLLPSVTVTSVQVPPFGVCWMVQQPPRNIHPPSASPSRRDVAEAAEATWLSSPRHHFRCIPRRDVCPTPKLLSMVPLAPITRRKLCAATPGPSWGLAGVASKGANWQARMIRRKHKSTRAHAGTGSRARAQSTPHRARLLQVLAQGATATSTHRSPAATRRQNAIGGAPPGASVSRFAWCARDSPMCPVATSWPVGV